MPKNYIQSIAPQLPDPLLPLWDLAFGEALLDALGEGEGDLATQLVNEGAIDGVSETKCGLNNILVEIEESLRDLVGGGIGI